MLAPHELKNKSFTRTMRGYNPQEVDEYIDFLVENYTALYRENSELERKLKIVVTNLDELKDEEESIRSTLLKSQKLSEKIIRDANEKADVITSSIKDRCDAIIADFREQLGEEKKEMWQIRTKVLDFKKNVYDLYRSHIEELQSISVNEIEDIVLPNESEIIGKIFTDVKGAIRDGIATDEKEREETDLNAVPAVPAEEEAPEPVEISDEDYLRTLQQKEPPAAEEEAPEKEETQDAE